MLAVSFGPLINPAKCFGRSEAKSGSSIWVVGSASVGSGLEVRFCWGSDFGCLTSSGSKKLPSPGENRLNVRFSFPSPISVKAGSLISLEETSIRNSEAKDSFVEVDNAVEEEEDTIGAKEDEVSAVEDGREVVAVAGIEV